MATWRVVGGSGPGPGGILVRNGLLLNSAALPERLGTGALVEQLELQGERLHFRLLSGTGPSEGWVSTKLKDKELMVKEGGEENTEMSDAEFLLSLGLSADDLAQEASTGPAEKGVTAKKADESSSLATAKNQSTTKEIKLSPVERYLSDIQRLQSGYRETVKLARLIREEKLDEAAEDQNNIGQRGSGRSQWQCVFKPRIAVRAGMHPEGKIMRTVNFGEKVEVVGEPMAGWLKLSDGNFALIQHEKLGVLLEPVGAAERAKRTARIEEVVVKMQEQLQACSIPTAGADLKKFSQEEDRAGDRIIKAMRAAEARLEEALGKNAAEEVISKSVAAPALQKDGTEMFTLDFLSIGRGRCLRCGTCSCLKWVYNLKDLRSSRCMECDCEAKAHKFLNEGVGEQPGYYPGISDEDMEKLEDMRIEFEKKASWH